MQLGLVLLLVLGYSWTPAHGFGYITSRFRPEPGYGNWGSANAYRVAFPQRVATPHEQLLEALFGAAGPEEGLEVGGGCGGRSCHANEHCCADHICMASFSGKASGTCMATGSQRGGDECATDIDCGDAMQCDLGVCTDIGADKAYGEDCSTSSECDGSRALCCQVIRRHRQAPKKMCSYYKDPMICLGRVSSVQLRHGADLTKGEKRLTGRSLAYNIRK